MRIVVTGGAGYIGSQLANRLQSAGHSILVFDNLSNGSQSCLHSEVKFKCRDIVTEKNLLRAELNAFLPQAVIHCAALADVEQSLQERQRYFDTNAGGTENIAEIAAAAGVKHFLFSSTAAVYGNVQAEKIAETHICQPINPYGESKLLAEKTLQSLAARTDMAVSCLRYFNVVAFSRGVTQRPGAASPALFPKVVRTLREGNTEFLIYGSDYPTSDGTCVRDYIHIEDLLSIHQGLLEKSPEPGGLAHYNCGSGQGGASRLSRSWSSLNGFRDATFLLLTPLKDLTTRPVRSLIYSV
jgi:UDP-glucose 4-epimerase